MKDAGEGQALAGKASKLRREACNELNVESTVALMKHVMIGLLALVCFNSNASAFERGYNEYGYVSSNRIASRGDYSHQRVAKNLYRGQRRYYRQGYQSTTRYAERSPAPSVARVQYASAGFTPIRDWPNNAKPGPWCGWYMRQVLGVADPSYNWAPNWMNYGHATGPEVGAVVVWPWHVGRIVGQSANGQWIVENGNYNNRIAVLPMSVAGAIGFRKG